MREYMYAQKLPLSPLAREVMLVLECRALQSVGALIWSLLTIERLPADVPAPSVEDRVLVAYSYSY